MAFSGQQKCFCVLQLAKSESIITVQRGFRTKYHIEPQTDKIIGDKLVFSDKACFHFSGKFNRHDVRIWGKENPPATVQHIRVSPKFNVFCAISSRKVYGPFFFAEKSVNGFAYLDMLQLCLLPQLQDSDSFILQQDGAPPHFHFEVRRHLNTTLPQRWIGSTSRCNENSALIPWPPRSADLTSTENPGQWLQSQLFRGFTYSYKLILV
jgi:hypothetical protein